MEKHILLIDDDEDEFEMFTDALAEISIPLKFSWADSAEEALKLMQHFIPDYIVLDYNMPKTNGLLCLAAIKKIPEIAHVPVIFYSTTINHENSSKALELGAVGCIKKPSDNRSLVKCIQPFLK